MDAEEAKKEVETLLRVVALLFGAVSAGVGAIVVLLIVSFFVDVSLAAAFMLQLLAAKAGAWLSLWRTS